jgi:hypothetical protein
MPLFVWSSNTADTAQCLLASTENTGWNEKPQAFNNNEDALLHRNIGCQSSAVIQQASSLEVIYRMEKLPKLL